MRPDTDALTRLYLDERRTTYEIGALYGVSRVSVTRWLKRAGIPVRMGGRGLVSRGVTEPTADDLRRMVHVEHRSYREIAAMFGVDPSAVMHWLKRHGIDRPTTWSARYGATAPAIPDAQELAALYASGLSLTEIGNRFGVSSRPIRARMTAWNVPLKRSGWDGGKRLPCEDGHSVRSTYEQRVCNWLTEQDIEHSYEPLLPWDLRSRADFMANGWYIEIWGVTNSPTYAARRARKIAGYRAHAAALVEINHFDFSSQKRGRWRRLLAVIGSSVQRPLFPKSQEGQPPLLV